MLTRKQQELLLYITREVSASGVSPSFDEMKDAINLKSKSGVHRLVSALEERGFIRRLANRARAIEILKHLDGSAYSENGKMTYGSALKEETEPFIYAPTTAVRDLIEVPLLGRIAAGTPIEAISTPHYNMDIPCLLYTSPSPRDGLLSRMPSSA